MLVSKTLLMNHLLVVLSIRLNKIILHPVMERLKNGLKCKRNGWTMLKQTKTILMIICNNNYNNYVIHCHTVHDRDFILIFYCSVITVIFYLFFYESVLKTEGRGSVIFFLLHIIIIDIRVSLKQRWMVSVNAVWNMQKMYQFTKGPETVHQQEYRSNHEHLFIRSRERKTNLVR